MSFDAPLLRIRAAVRILKGEFQMKQYQKPEVNYENFALAEHIALCNYKLGLADVGTCKIEADRVSNDIDYADWIFDVSETSALLEEATWRSAFSFCFKIPISSWAFSRPA